MRGGIGKMRESTPFNVLMDYDFHGIGINLLA